MWQGDGFPLSMKPVKTIEHRASIFSRINSLRSLIFQGDGFLTSEDIRRGYRCPFSWCSPY